MSITATDSAITLSDCIHVCVYILGTPSEALVVVFDAVDYPNGTIFDPDLTKTP